MDDDIEIIFTDSMEPTNVCEKKTKSNRRKKQTKFAKNTTDNEKETTRPIVNKAEMAELEQLRRIERKANRLFREAQRLPTSDESTSDSDQRQIWSDRALNWHKQQNALEETERLIRVNNLLDK